MGTMNETPDCLRVYFLPVLFSGQTVSKSEVFQNLKCCYTYYIPKINLLVWAKIKDCYED